MSVKRTATTDLNHDNWDQEDPSDKEERGMFKVASKDVLEKRVIRTAKRRAPISTIELNKSAFSGFGGFNKTQPSSFDFLANLTNGNKNSNGAKDDSKSASLFSSKPTATSSGGLFGLATTSSAKPAFGSTSSPFSSLSSTSKTESPPMTFSSSKADSTIGDAFKMKPVASSTDTSEKPSTAQVPSLLFGGSNTSPIQPIKTATPFSNNPEPKPTPIQNSDAEKEKELARNKYYSKLKGLNESVSSWIVKHVEITPLCFLTPIFRDYENYLQDIQEEYEASKKKIEELPKPEPAAKQTTYKELSPPASPVSNNTSSAAEAKTTEEPKSTSLFSSNQNKTSTLFTNSDLGQTTTPTKGFSFGITPISTSSSSPAKPETTAPSQGFSFGVTSTASNSKSIFSATTTTSGSPAKGFSFGVATSTATSPVSSSLFSSSSTGTPTKGFSFGMSTPAATSPTGTATAPGSFSFGIAGSKPFSFSPQTHQSAETKPEAAAEDEDQPPKVEYKPVVEENSVYDKKCKIFVKKDGNFADKGVGTLYIKKIEESGKHQLLVRANTNLGTVLLNLILASAVPTQRMGKNNVMLVCIPTPDSKPPPTPILIRVKTGEEADELLETLNKYKS